MKTLSALQSVVLLTGVSLFGQAMGVVYRIYLSRLVGAEVLGLYQLVMPLFSVFLSLTSVGFTTACSHLTARYRATGNHAAARQTVRRCTLGFLCSFTLLALVAAPLSDALSVHVLRDARTQLGILLLLPCVLLTGLENLHKHAFYGSGLPLPPAASEICEQLIRTGAVLGLLWHFLPQSPEKAVGLIVCGMVLCEIFSAVTLSVLYRRFAARSTRGEGVAPEMLDRHIRHIALPVGWNALLGNLMGCATAVLIPHLLVRSGQGGSDAMATFGVLCGMTLPLLSLPTACISALGLVLLPRLSSATALGRRDLSRRRIGKALSAVSCLLLPACTLLAVLSPTLGRALYQDETVGAYALPLALSVALSGLCSVLAVSLNGLGLQRVTARNGLLSGGVQLGLTYCLMSRPGVGLRGYVEAAVLTGLLTLLLQYHSVKKAVHLPFQPFPWLIAPGLTAILTGLTSRLLLHRLLDLGLEDLPACGLTASFALLLCLACLSGMGVVRVEKRHGQRDPARG